MKNYIKDKGLTVFVFSFDEVVRVAKGKYQEWLEPDGLLRLEAWARDGLTDEQIAANLGVTRRTFFNWKENHLPIFHALKRGKEVVDIQVENALLKRALGYEYSEENIEISKDKNGKIIHTKVKQTIKQVVPDTTAQIFWLKNRRPDKWRDKIAVTEENTEIEDDGFIEALNAKVGELDWSDDE